MLSRGFSVPSLFQLGYPTVKWWTVFVGQCPGPELSRPFTLELIAVAFRVCALFKQSCHRTLSNTVPLGPCCMSRFGNMQQNGGSRGNRTHSGPHRPQDLQSWPSSLTVYTPMKILIELLEQFFATFIVASINAEARSYKCLLDVRCFC